MHNLIKLVLISLLIINFNDINSSEDIKYATAQDIEAMGAKAAASLTPLMEAIQQDELDTLNKELAKPNVDINAADIYGQTALHHAAQKNSIEMVKALLKIANINSEITDKQELTPLDIAITNGNADIVKALLKQCAKKCKNINKRDKIGYTPLMRAAHIGNNEIITSLLQAGANPTITISKYGYLFSPADWLESEHADEDKQKISEDKKEVYKLLKSMEKEYTDRGKAFMDALKNGKFATDILAKGINANVTDNYGDNLLYKAVKLGNKNIVQELINAGAYVDRMFSSPLLWAASNGVKEMVQILLDNKANVNIKNYEQETPVFLAAKNGHKDIVELLIKNKADVNQADELGETPLHWAAEKGYKDIAQMLIAAKADVNAMDRLGYTALLSSARNGHKDIVKMLIDAKADVNTKGIFGNTPLIYSAQNGYKEIVQMLIKAKADINAKNNDGWQPLLMAARGDNIDIVELLIKAGATVDAENIQYVGYVKNENIVPMLQQASVTIGKSNIPDKQDKKSKIVELLINKGKSIQ